MGDLLTRTNSGSSSLSDSSDLKTPMNSSKYNLLSINSPLKSPYKQKKKHLQIKKINKTI